VWLLAVSRPVSADIDHTHLRRIATFVEDAIQAGLIPGAVVLVGHQGEVVYERAFGVRAVDDVVEPMTVDTVFDLASLTKAVATTTSVMVLLEEGRLRLRDPVVAHIPEFSSHDKGTITVQHLLTHVSGLRPDLPLADAFEGAVVAIARTADEIPEAAPGERFTYSDLNFMLLAEIVRRVSGQTLGHFSRDRIFAPLGMRDTLFTPPLALVPRIAPTEACGPLAWPCGGPGARMLRGKVHDPTARRMGGRSRGSVQHRGRSRSFQPDAAGRGRIRWDSGAGTAHRCADDPGFDPTPAGGPPRSRVGHRLAILVEPRRPLFGRVLWTHWFHGHLAVA
jgi:CubicO group peptidase (beta-lactamase class C family)